MQAQIRKCLADVKALDALMVAKQLNIRLSAMSAADAVAEVTISIPLPCSLGLQQRAGFTGHGQV